MDSDVAHSRIRTALRAELKRRHGQIGQIEADLDRSEGYLSRFCRGDMELTLKGCLEVLEALKIEPGSFFSTTFGSAPTSESVLRKLAGEPKDRSIGTISHAIELLVSNDEASAAADGQSRRLHKVSVQDLAGESVEVQIRRLRTAKKYRNETFAEEYLDWLETLRSDDPRTASRLVVSTLQYVVPLTAATKRRRIELFCKGLSTFAACSKSRDDLRTAFWSIHQGLRLADAVNFVRTRSDLLRRAGAFCAAIPDYETGLVLLGDAIELAVECGDQKRLGMALASRAILQLYSGRETNARRGFERSVELLASFSDRDREARLSEVSAYSGLVNLCTNRGDTQEARHWLGRAISCLRSEGGLALGKLLWQKGSLERTLGALVPAIESYQQALQYLETGSVVDSALLSAELASAYLDAGRHSEAIVIAKGMASLADSLRDCPSAQTALLDFLRLVLKGDLNKVILAEFVAGLERSGRSGSGARSNQRESKGPPPFLSGGFIPVRAEGMPL